MALPSGVRKTHPPSRCPQHGKGFKFDIMVTYGDRMAWVLDSEEAANCEKETVGSVRIRLRACNRLPSFCGFIKQFTTFLSSLSLQRHQQSPSRNVNFFMFLPPFAKKLAHPV